MVLTAVVEAVPADSKLLAVVVEHISPGERHGFGASASSSTKASSLQGRAGGTAKSSPKLVRRIGS